MTPSMWRRKLVWKGLLLLPSILHTKTIEEFGYWPAVSFISMCCATGSRFSAGTMSAEDVCIGKIHGIIDPEA